MELPAMVFRIVMRFTKENNLVFGERRKRVVHFLAASKIEPSLHVTSLQRFCKISMLE